MLTESTTDLWASWLEAIDDELNERDLEDLIDCEARPDDNEATV
jgi:hypothetical protein